MKSTKAKNLVYVSNGTLMASLLSTNVHHNETLDMILLFIITYIMTSNNVSFLVICHVAPHYVIGVHHTMSLATITLSFI